MPQPPQLFGSLVTSTQPMLPPQSIAPASHTHAPDTHEPEGPQLLPQEPQFCASFDRFAQVFCAMQATSPAGQALQAPLMHICPARHSLPQPPQFIGSLETSTQPVAQVMSPGSHVQAPLMQVAPTKQPLPHTPQLASSTAGSTHTPLHSSGRFAGQAHTPETHEPLTAHAFPHAPQLPALLDRSAHTP